MWPGCDCPCSAASCREQPEERRTSCCGQITERPTRQNISLCQLCAQKPDCPAQTEGAGEDCVCVCLSISYRFPKTQHMLLMMPLSYPTTCSQWICLPVQSSKHMFIIDHSTTFQSVVDPAVTFGTCFMYMYIKSLSVRTFVLKWI